MMAVPGIPQAGPGWVLVGVMAPAGVAGPAWLSAGPGVGGRVPPGGEVELDLPQRGMDQPTEPA
jgi:hypothetical protein